MRHSRFHPGISAHYKKIHNRSSNHYLCCACSASAAPFPRWVQLLWEGRSSRVGWLKQTNNVIWGCFFCFIVISLSWFVLSPFCHQRIFSNRRTPVPMLAAPEQSPPWGKLWALRCLCGTMLMSPLKNEHWQMKILTVATKLAAFFILLWMKPLLNGLYIKEMISLSGIIQSVFHSQSPFP